MAISSDALGSTNPQRTHQANVGETGSAAIPLYLSPRRAEILRNLAVGQKPGEIALSLGISRDTVYEAIEETRKRLGAKTNCEMIAIALAYGLISPQKQAADKIDTRGPHRST